MSASLAVPLLLASFCFCCSALRTAASIAAWSGKAWPCSVSQSKQALWWDLVPLLSFCRLVSSSTFCQGPFESQQVKTQCKGTIRLRIIPHATVALYYTGAYLPLVAVAGPAKGNHRGQR